MVGTVRKIFDGFLIVGGGIRDAKAAKALAAAGADALVVGTITESGGGVDKLTEMVRVMAQP